ncbi:hypothetical protein CALCODRAFT_505418 [Calocera cornea HHB12733]|uniref:Uncharacterized protein n=1 Tax=Calocera cornea HHB12733 TaxID=1353952 RepID=A0A165K3W5_9BASI|nr:hypothetical protein CALCODRAFT_505418 [Calocera cornea HHB12733]
MSPPASDFHAIDLNSNITPPGLLDSTPHGTGDTDSRNSDNAHANHAGTAGDRGNAEGVGWWACGFGSRVKQEAIASAQDVEASVALLQQATQARSNAYPLSQMSVQARYRELDEYNEDVYIRQHRARGRVYGYDCTTAYLQCFSWCGHGAFLRLQNITLGTTYCCEMTGACCVSCADMVSAGGCAECCCGFFIIVLLLLAVVAIIVGIVLLVLWKTGVIWTAPDSVVGDTLGIVPTAVAAITSALQDA